MRLVSPAPVPWLTNKGHLNPLVQSAAPSAAETLRSVFLELGGDEEALSNKVARPLKPDFRHEELGCLVEIDELQHFTSARLLTLDRYSSEPLGFSVDVYRNLIAEWHLRADGFRRNRGVPGGEFPGDSPRRRQRAYFDAVRDLLAPSFTGQPILRVAIPECSAPLAFERLEQAVADWQPR